MKEQIQKIRGEFQALARGIKDVKTLEEVRVKFLGRKGLLTEVLRGLKDLSLEERKDIGALAHEAKKEIERALTEKEEVVGAASQQARVDVSLPGIRQSHGSLNPLTIVERELVAIFTSLGFDRYEDTILATEERDFDHLNFAPDHPARDSMDTFWISEDFQQKKANEKWCIRPHLTGMSVEYMKTHTPPFRFTYPGTAFRNEATDARHEHSFCQFEALIVDESVTFAHGKHLIQTLLNRFFQKEVKVRMRSGYFPFVEPGFEIDIHCLICDGKGCPVCKYVGWVELMPGGMPQENVLKAGGLDPSRWQGFYINVGIDRLALMRYGIEDIRHFRSGDLRFLKQF